MSQAGMAELADAADSKREVHIFHFLDFVARNKTYVYRRVCLVWCRWVFLSRFSLSTATVARSGLVGNPATPSATLPIETRPSVFGTP